MSEQSILNRQLLNSYHEHDNVDFIETECLFCKQVIVVLIPTNTPVLTSPPDHHIFCKDCANLLHEPCVEYNFRFTRELDK